MNKLQLNCVYFAGKTGFTWRKLDGGNLQASSFRNDEMDRLKFGS